MERTTIAALKEHTGKTVTVNGWVDVRRDHGKLIFLDIRDASGSVQAVALPSHDGIVDAASELRPEWVVAVEGVVNERPEKMVNPDIQNGDIELEITGIAVLSRAAELPFEKDAELNIDTYLDHLPLTLRSKRSRAIFELQADLIESFRSALRDERFTEFQAPGIAAGDAEGGANVFKVEYFKERTAYLATSPQFYKQIMVGILERAFTTAKVFRAEPHATTRHLNEYSTLDFEFGFIKDHTDVMDMLTRVMRRIVAAVHERHAQTMAAFDQELPVLPEQVPVMKLREAQAIIKEYYGEDCTDEPDLAPQHEERLSEYAKQEYGSDFLFVTHYPVSKRPFYTYEDESDPGFTKSFDLLFRGVEITTGGQRIHDHDTLVENMKKWNLDPEVFSYYLEAFKYGMPPHGGCATGLERLTAKFLGLKNVKEATLFPRDMNRIDRSLSQ